MYSGTIDPVARTFDIAGISETNTSISVINNQLRLSWVSESGELVQLKKDINPGGGGTVPKGSKLSVSPCEGTDGGGYAVRGNKFGQTLTAVDFAAPGQLQTKTFVDVNGVSRVAVLVPVVL